MLEEFFQKFDGAFSPNTIRAYRADFTHFLTWCQDHGATALPADEKTLAKYIEDQGVTHKSATIRRRIHSLGTLFRLSKYPDPTKDAEVILALKRVHRRIGRTQNQARPLTQDLLTQMLCVCKNDVRGLRDQVLLCLGYETMRRRSELCSMRFEDLATFPNGKPYLLLPFSKTDQYGEGVVISISPDLVTLIEKWKRKIGTENGFILRSVSKKGKVGQRLHPSSVNLLLQDLQFKAFGRRQGHPFSGHSFRVGAAIDLLEQGETIDRIMIKGGWRSESTAIRYLRNYCAQVSANNRSE